MGTSEHTTNWSDLAIGLYDRLTDRSAEITYQLEDMHINVPSGVGPDAQHAKWVLSGTLKIRTKDLDSSPN